MPTPSRRHTAVAFQGEHGAFSEEAALRFFGSSIRALPCATFDRVFESVEKRTAAYGIVPIENSLFGSIHQNYDLLTSHRLSIMGEVKLRIRHALLVLPGTPLKRVRAIYSHPQALGQCERFLRSLKGIDAHAVYDTAGAAKMINEEQRADAAAIASENAGRIYGLKVLRRGIESDKTNYTRFLVLARTQAAVPPRAAAKTSIVFAMKDVPGALFKALSVFALREINLHKIESRPMVGKPWEYLFYADFQGRASDEPCRNALRHLGEITKYLKVLGSYPEGATIDGDKQR